ncbi:MAG: hypothetical protein OEM67_09655 [Thermoleophilia bacterium]|nr:hypothetical protein [Thermoleophilia bacterium]MDH3725311.1 hypothetical protein [Thermoleophilia bacterium]
MAEPYDRIPKSSFVNIDGRIRCPTDECWGDLLLMPTGRTDEEGFPSYRDLTACPLCLRSFPLEDDITDRDLYLRISWLRANPDAMPDDPAEQGPHGPH